MLIDLSVTLRGDETSAALDATASDISLKAKERLY